MRDGEANQRSGFQFELFKLNLVVNAALIAFALNNEAWSRALLACPFISFILFSLWFHHALAIRFDPEEIAEVRHARGSHVAQIIRRWSFAAAVVTNFVGVPLGAILIYQIKGYSWLAIFAGTLLAVTVVMFGFWFYLQYYWGDIEQY